jgi:hypothetical protein
MARKKTTMLATAAVALLLLSSVGGGEAARASKLGKKGVVGKALGKGKGKGKLSKAALAVGSDPVATVANASDPVIVSSSSSSPILVAAAPLPALAAKPAIVEPVVIADDPAPAILEPAVVLEPTVEEETLAPLLLSCLEKNATYDTFTVKICSSTLEPPVNTTALGAPFGVRLSWRPVRDLITAGGWGDIPAAKLSDEVLSACSVDLPGLVLTADGACQEVALNQWLADDTRADKASVAALSEACRLPPGPEADVALRVVALGALAIGEETDARRLVLESAPSKGAWCGSLGSCAAPWPPAVVAAAASVASPSVSPLPLDVVVQVVPSPSPVVVPVVPSPSPIVPVVPVVPSPSPVMPVVAASPSPLVEEPLPSSPSPIVEEPLLSSPSPVVEEPLLSSPSPVVEETLPSSPSPVVEASPSPAVEEPLPSPTPL